ncbi:hypothetical protein [Luteipulveratus mongoliensis]|uniref:Uncharacterized protein n=1 Tax=Luteipulveratus mongoliensis TaxID=571913 RepID=A0A0K1JJV9_9MICO|nr:hypothetical protein [Luteipulveratus mongoliensis]AKU17014.1 hypothetical protein VV02_16010 [Luteipulveratus mongoliensis]
MNANTIRRSALVASGTLVAAAGLITGTGLADAAPSGGAHAAVSSGVVPPPGAPTAYGYTALVRHATGPTDNKGALVLLAPNGQHTTIGAVSNDAFVLDISSNARTIVTGFFVGTGSELRLTIWDAETKKPTYLRVPNGSTATLVKDGLVVSRYDKPAQLFSRAGKLLKTYSGGASGELAATADGTRVLQSDTAGRVFVRDVAGGTIIKTVPIPKGERWCTPDYQYGATEFTMSCSKDAGFSQVYRFGLATSTAAILTVSHDNQAQSGRKVSAGVLFDASTESPAPTPMLAKGNTFTSLKVGGVPNYSVAGAYGDAAYLWGDGQDWTPWNGIYRYTISTGKTTKVAGTNTPLGGFVTSAVTVDGT